MKSTMIFSSVLSALFVSTLPSQAKDAPANGAVPVNLTVTADVPDGKRCLRSSSKMSR